tara:strand:- start:1300 stop:1515 length:216 start_codon:yes stop_codon:yes gene_type:complete
MLNLDPKKFKNIQNKRFPSPLRPKFRNSNETNIYFLSKRRCEKKNKEAMIRKVRILFIVIFTITTGYLLSV